MASRSVCLLILCAFFWSLGGVLIKAIDWNPLGIAGTRSLIALVIFSVFLPKSWSRLSLAVMAGAVAYAGTVTSFVFATKMTSAANAIFLQYTAPVYVALLSPWLVREKIQRRDWFFIALALLGVALFFFDQLTPKGWMGIGFGLLSGLFFGLFILLLRRQSEGFPQSIVLYGNLLTVVVALPFIFPARHLATNWPWLAALGVFQLTLPYLLYAHAIRHVRALDAALVTFIEPILNPCWVLLVNREVPSAWSLAGGTLVLAATAARTLLRRRPGLAGSRVTS
ncbi:MAG TPA: DMT family transporter [Chthoniobacterales bacterium]